MAEIVLPNEFEPRPYQQGAMRYFDNGGTRAITVWHRRAGKDLTAMHQTCKAAHQETGLYWHIFPTAEMARKMIWTGFTRTGQRIMELVFPRAIRKSPREWAPNGEMVVELRCGSVWRMIGSDKADSVGAGPKGVVLSEYALAKPTAWDLIRPMLRESRGWAWFITTPRGANHAKKLYDQADPGSGWYRDLKTVHDTGLTYASNRRPGAELSPDEMIAEELAEGMPPELADQEYRCSWTAANVGSFYGILLGAVEARGGIGHTFNASGDDVFTFWDLGKTDDTAIWWMRFREGTTQEAPCVDVLDHYASHGDELEHYFAILEERAKKHGWKYRKHVLPHDARAKRLGTRLTIAEQCVERLGHGMVEIGPEVDLADGIAAVRWLLQRDIRFHQRCSAIASPKDCDGVEAIRAYHRHWDDERKCFSETPVHDWSSHTADSFRYLAVFSRYGQYLRTLPKAPPKKVDTRRPTLAEMWEDTERRRER